MSNVSKDLDPNIALAIVIILLKLALMNLSDLDSPKDDDSTDKLL
jgi:hypothetical protein